MGSLSDRFGPRIFMTVGPLVMAGGSLLLLTVTDPVNYWLQLLPGLILFATLATIVAGSLDLDGFRRAAIVTAGLMVAGGIVSFLGIRNSDVAPVENRAEPATGA